MFCEEFKAGSFTDGLWRINFKVGYTKMLSRNVEEQVIGSTPPLLGGGGGGGGYTPEGGGGGGGGGGLVPH
jgi:hypothetical protein